MEVVSSTEAVNMFQNVSICCFDLLCNVAPCGIVCHIWLAASISWLTHVDARWKAVLPLAASGAECKLIIKRRLAAECSRNSREMSRGILLWNKICRFVSVEWSVEFMYYILYIIYYI